MYVFLDLEKGRPKKVLNSEFAVQEKRAFGKLIRKKVLAIRLSRWRLAEKRKNKLARIKKASNLLQVPFQSLFPRHLDG